MQIYNRLKNATSDRSQIPSISEVRKQSQQKENYRKLASHYKDLPN